MKRRKFVALLGSVFLTVIDDNDKLDEVVNTQDVLRKSPEIEEMISYQKGGRGW